MFVGPVFGNNIEHVNIVVMIELQVKMLVQSLPHIVASGGEGSSYSCVFIPTVHKMYIIAPRYHYLRIHIHANSSSIVRAFSYAISVRAYVYARRYTYVASHPPR